MIISNKITAGIIRDALKTELINATIDSVGTLKQLGKSDSLMLIDTIQDNIYAIKAIINKDNWISFNDEVKDGLQKAVGIAYTSDDNVSNLQAAEILR